MVLKRARRGRRGITESAPTDDEGFQQLAAHNEALGIEYSRAIGVLRHPTVAHAAANLPYMFECLLPHTDREGQRCCALMLNEYKNLYNHIQKKHEDVCMYKVRHAEQRYRCNQRGCAVEPMSQHRLVEHCRSIHGMRLDTHGKSADWGVAVQEDEV